MTFDDLVLHRVHVLHTVMHNHNGGFDRLVYSYGGQHNYGEVVAALRYSYENGLSHLGALPPALPILPLGDPSLRRQASMYEAYAGPERSLGKYTGRGYDIKFRRVE